MYKITKYTAGHQTAYYSLTFQSEKEAKAYVKNYASQWHECPSDYFIVGGQIVSNACPWTLEWWDEPEVNEWGEVSL